MLSVVPIGLAVTLVPVACVFVVLFCTGVKLIILLLCTCVNQRSTDRVILWSFDEPCLTLITVLPLFRPVVN